MTGGGPVIARALVDVVIVNFNAGQLLRFAMESLTDSQANSFRLGQVIIVDNASTDGSIDHLDRSSLPVRLIRNESNLGFAAACNQGAATCMSKYLLFLNPDVRLSATALDVAMRLMEDAIHSTTGIVGIKLIDDRGRVMRTCARFPKPHHMLVRALGLHRAWPITLPGHAAVEFIMTDWDHTSTRVVDHVPGAFFLVRRSLFQRLNGFDTRFFVYFEDLDFSLRAKNVGASTQYVAEAYAHHTGGGTSRKVVNRRLLYSSVSTVRYSFKHFGRAWGCLILTATLIVEPVARAAWAIVHGRWPDIKATMRATTDLWSEAPHLLADGLRLTPTASD